MSELFDFKSFALKTQNPTKRPAPPRRDLGTFEDRKVDGKFLAGPIALSWLTPALRLGKPAIKTALALWYQCGLNEGALIFSINQSRCQEFALSRFDARKGLKALEAAGLIAILQANRGKKFKIQLIKTGRRKGDAP